jgi:hypothetical protein
LEAHWLADRGAQLLRVLGAGQVVARQADGLADEPLAGLEDGECRAADVVHVDAGQQLAVLKRQGQRQYAVLGTFGTHHRQEALEVEGGVQ